MMVLYSTDLVCEYCTVLKSYCTQQGRTQEASRQIRFKQSRPDRAIRKLQFSIWYDTTQRARAYKLRIPPMRVRSNCEGEVLLQKFHLDEFLRHSLDERLVMGRKKKRQAPSEAERIFCYYCDRKFQTEQILLSHQKEKHLRCPTCNKRLFSISGLVIHSTQVHNVQVTSVPNAIEGRTSTAVDVVGMTGIPASYYTQSAAKAARLDPNAQAPPVPVYDAPPPSVPGYPQYPDYGNSVPSGYYPPYGTAPYSASAGYGYGNGYANGYPQQYPGRYPSYAPQHYAPHHQPYAPVYSTGAVPQSVGHSAAGVGGQSPVPAHPVKGIVPSQPSTTTEAPKLNSGPALSPVVLAKAPQQVKVVFELQDVSMEEMRARLPRYKLA